MELNSPEISVIVCSKTGKPLEVFSSSLDNTIGVEYEIIIIDNSNNEHSIFSAYDQGASCAKGNVLCFVHEDVEFYSENWGKRLIAFFQDTPACGIAGVAGGDVISSVPTDWLELHPAINLIQCHEDENCTHVKTGISTAPHSAIWIDGVFLAMRSEIYGSGNGKIRFNASCKGFHAYDLDISIQSFFANYENFVLPDLLLKHLSAGLYDARYYKAIVSVLEKYASALPIFHPRVTESEKAYIKSRQKRQFKRMLKVLIRNHCSTKEIISLSNPVILRCEKMYLFQHTLPLQIFFIKLRSILGNKMR